MGHIRKFYEYNEYSCFMFGKITKLKNAAFGNEREEKNNKRWNGLTYSNSNVPEMYKFLMINDGNCAN